MSWMAAAHLLSAEDWIVHCESRGVFVYLEWGGMEDSGMVGYLNRGVTSFESNDFSNQF